MNAESILIIGGTGSLGRKLITRLIKYNCVAVYSRDESKHWTLKNELISDPNVEKLTFHVGDIRDKDRLFDVIRQCHPTIIIIAAALKHVDTCELSPKECIMTNVIGTQNVIDIINANAANFYHDMKVLFVSTDKACSPVNSYGMSKALSERIVTSQVQTGRKIVKYLAVRYGNVLESRGSIIPLFKYQCEHNTHITVTDPNMTRFVMTLDDSVSLIEKTLINGRSGETWTPKLPAMKIGDLAEIFSERYNKPIKFIGLRPGEKMHEDLINESESARSYITSDNKNTVILPSFVIGTNEPFTYRSSDSVLSKNDLNLLLEQLGIFNLSINSFKGLSVEEIMTNRI